MNQEIHSINDSDDPKESHPETVCKYINQKVQNNIANNVVPVEKHKQQSAQHTDNNVHNDVAKKSQASKQEKEKHPEQPNIYDVEQPDVPDAFRSRRRLHGVDVLLNPGNSTKSLLDASKTMEGEDELQISDHSPDCLRATCLNPKFGLHTQFLLTFGSASAFIIAVVLIISVIFAWNAGENIKSVNEVSFTDLVRGNKGRSARILAESLTPTLIPEDVVRIIHESVRDRFAGYPNDGDEFVPFYDIDSKRNMYPVVGVTGRSLPLDWQIETNVNVENYEEHVQGRWSWYDSEQDLSTANAFYIMQGICDPSVTNQSASTYWENCTDANNDISVGGIINPSPTNYQIYLKSNSLSPVLKSVFESHQDIYNLGIYFSNDGAGSVVSYPHYELNTNVAYTSVGCEWMNTPNPFEPSRPIGTEEMIRKCRPDGANVSSRLYNAMERGWCRDQALNPFRPIVDGPYLSAWEEGRLIASIGQGIYDRITNDFIGCIFVGLYLNNLEDNLFNVRVTENSEVSVARFDDGTAVASTAWDSSAANETIRIYDLSVGLTFDSYMELKTLVDYTKAWEPAEVREKYETFAVRHDGFLLAVYPIPPVPESHDPNYEPLLFVMLSTSEEDIFQVIKDVKENIDGHMIQVMFMSLIVGAIGLVTVLLIIYLMSKALTAPLEYMNTAADEVINHFGKTISSTEHCEIINRNPGHYCFPRTELDEVVKEFNQMVTSFSGSFASSTKCLKDGREEIPNKFSMQKDFHDLYRSRRDVIFDYRVGITSNCATDMPQFINMGSIINNKDDSLGKVQQSVVCDETQGKGGLTSRLFFWTVLLIGTPLMLTAIAISVVVMSNMSQHFLSSIEAAESFYIEVQLNASSVYTTLWAHVVSSGMSRPTRDLYLLTRYASWLLFGALERAVSFTEVKTSLEQCKAFNDTTNCPFFEDNYFCDCAWNDDEPICDNYTYDTRSRQDLFFACESSDTLPNGDRNSTSYPEVSYSPETTFWWDDVRNLPGSKKWITSSGYDTTYDRLRVVSASPMHQVVYNQDIKKDYTVGNDIAFEADGLFLVFSGCSSVRIPILSKWSSTEKNGAYKLRPELCPLGKYGYDPRCRGWYDTGKRLAEADGTPLHVTPPYVFADNSIGQSATSPLMNPQTNEHLGQVLIDFKSGPMLDSFVNRNTPLVKGGFSLLITTLSGPDSVVGPGFSFLNESAAPSSELVLPYDHNCNETACKVRISRFEQIVSSMKNGEDGMTKFTRLSPTGLIETVYMTYAPIIVRSYRPLDSSDFSRGMKSEDVLIYSLALAQTEEDLLVPFKAIEEENNMQIRLSILALSVLIFLSILFAIYIISVVILSVIDPMFVLLDVINSINRLDVDEEPPIINRSNGSKELNTFAETIQTLYKVARCGNIALLSGDLEKAYDIMHDACGLFKQLDNNKAVGVVSNNLGNLLLAVFAAMNDADVEHFCDMTKTDIICNGISFYFDAIKLGEEAYDELHEKDGWSPNCLDFMQHLSNRYFNRGLFLLAVKDVHTQPEELEKLGYRDLDIATDLDKEIADIGKKYTEPGGNVTSVLKKFDVSLVRVRGYLMLQEMGYPDTWDVEEKLDRIFKMVKKEIHKNYADSSLFQTVKATGRLQEIETELIRYKNLKGEIRLAAQIGIRMLVEDEYVFPDAQETALEAILTYIDELMDVGAIKRAELIRRLNIFKTTRLGEGSIECFPPTTIKPNTPKVVRDNSDYSTLMSRRSTAVRDSRLSNLAMEELSLEFGFNRTETCPVAGLVNTDETYDDRK